MKTIKLWIDYIMACIHFRSLTEYEQSIYELNEQAPKDLFKIWKARLKG